MHVSDEAATKTTTELATMVMMTTTAQAKGFGELDAFKLLQAYLTYFQLIYLTLIGILRNALILSICTRDEQKKKKKCDILSFTINNTEIEISI